MSKVANIQDYQSSQDDPGSRKYGTFSYLPEMDAPRMRKQIEHMIAKGWNPAIEHVEPAHSADNYWYMWKLPMFGEKDIERILAEVEECGKAWPNHLVRLIGYDNYTQSQGASMVVHRPGS